MRTTAGQGADAPPEPGRSALGRIVVPAALFVGVIVVHLAMAASMKAPIVQPDELGYLDNARHLALGGARPVTAYYPGLSVLLAPVWRLTHDPLAVWHAALGLNSVLCGSTALVAWALIPRLGGATISTTRRLVIAFAVSAYPAVALYSNVSMSESLFAFGAALVVLLATRTLANHGDAAKFFVLGLAGALLTSVHPRGVALAIAVLIVGGLVGGRATRGDGPQHLLGLVAGTVAGWGICRVLLVAVRPARGAGLGTYQASAVLARATAPGATRLLALGLIGQAWYLTIATVGLAPLGIAVGLKDFAGIVAGRVRATPASAGRALVGLSACGILAMSVLFLDGGNRVDHLIYGRYNEGAIVGVLIVATTWVLSPARPAARRCLVWLASGGAVVLFGTVALSMGLTPAQRSSALNPSTVLALDSVLRLTRPGLDLGAIGLIGGVAVAIAAAVAWRAPTVAMALVVGVFGWAAYGTYDTYVRPGSEARSEQNVVATTIAGSSSLLGIRPTCVSFDAGVEFTYFEDRFYLPGWRIDPIDGSSGANPCPYAISTRPNFFSYHPGSQIVTVENDLPMILYVMPGPVLTRLRQAGWLLPAVVPGPLDVSSQRATVSASGAPKTLPAGRSASVTVRAANIGRIGSNPWPNVYGFGTAKYAVRATARWFRAGTLPTAPGQAGAEPLAASVVEVPRTLLPCQAVSLRIPLDPRTRSGAKLTPGRYTVLVAVYQELVGTIPGGVLSLPVTIIG